MSELSESERAEFGLEVMYLLAREPYSDAGDTKEIRALAIDAIRDGLIVPEPT